MTDNIWQFSPISSIEEYGFDRSLERFLMMGIYGLTRENIQNSLDARLSEDEPVIVKINTGDMDVENIPGINEIKERIMSLKGGNTYTKETIDHMKNKLNEEVVRYISFEDMNTKGLSGAKRGQYGTELDTWHVYAYNKGMHFEEADTVRESMRGGSHGIGKIASNASSDLHVMFFANCDENGEKHLGGTAQLTEHMYKDHAYRASGYFAKKDEDGKYLPFENNYHSIFEKNTRGLKIVVPYLREEFDKEDEIIKSICDSFFVAILDNNLEVHVNDKKITKETIKDFIQDPAYYNQRVEEIRENFTPLYLETYTNCEPIQITVNNMDRDFTFDLYFNYDERISRGRVGIVRTIGMKIEDFKVRSNIKKPFNAVLIGGIEEDEYIKSLENESHTKLEIEKINDSMLRKRATRFINQLHLKVAKVISEAIDEANPIDGKLDTKDILYVIDTNFKKEVEKQFGTVHIKKGQTLVKTDSGEKKEKRERKNGKGDKEQTEPKKKRKRKPIKVQRGKRHDSDEGSDRLTYSVHPEFVQRAVIQDKEIIKIDFKNTPDIQGVESCNLRLSIIDGMGQEYKDSINLIDNYDTAVDLHNNVPCKIDHNTIQNIPIVDGVMNLQLKLTDKYNHALKYVYYVEV